ncbi:MAG TPA: chromosomal replication initiator protein DnaA [Syntrophomonas wolfei]|uniref:Chromosomal replication initiator protein DnaA n=1 Tax=Syntrophomonas wolfei TaxID=863 RepID=A0A354YTH7_9FIRM|nr:chromosomal replication initiator protein DnaA [Syntrophomonas wolfei]
MSNYKDYSLVWNEVLDSMYQEIGSTSFEIWFSRVKFSSFHDNIFCIIVPDSLTKEWIESRYLDIMQNKLRRLIDPRVVLSIRTEILSGISDPVSALNPKYTFDTFVVGNSNRFAHAACYAVGESPFKSYNPLFIYGGVGLGKTHLMQAIGHHILSKKPNYLVMYVSSEQFTNDMISSIKDDTTSLFRNKYRSIDVLLVDDIQFLAGKERTQEEFFHTFNTLYEAKKQIVLTSDRPPKDIAQLEERLLTRFEWGLTADIQPPDFETRIAIIKRKAELLKIDLPDNVIEYIANRLKNNIRQLEGAVKKMKAFHLLNGDPFTIQTAQSAISDIINNDQPTPMAIEKIIDEVARTFGTTGEDIRSSKRSANISSARQVAMYVIREITQIPMAAIGKEFGGRDHSTVVYAIQQVEKNIARDAKMKATVEDIIKNIRDR